MTQLGWLYDEVQNTWGVSEIESGGSNPEVGVVAKLNGSVAQAIASSSWDQLDLSTMCPAGLTAPVPEWASLDGMNLVIDPSAGILVVTQVWGIWETNATGASRGLLLAHAGGGTPQFLDDAATILSPAQYAALADFEGSMGVDGINRVDPVDGLTLQFFAWQDSGAPLDLDLGICFVCVVA